MATTATTHTLARHTATMAQIGSTAACLLEPDPGSMVSAEAIGAAGVITVVEALPDALALTGARMPGADLATPHAADTHAAEVSHEDPLAVDSAAAVAVDSHAVGEATVEAVSTAVVAHMVVAAMAVGIGN